MRIIFVLFVLSSAGCYSFGNRAIADRSRIEMIVVGETSKTEIVAIMGEPASSYWDSSGVETWMYSYTSARANPAQFIPLVGLFVVPNVDCHTLMVTFGPDGKVRNVSRTQMRTGSGSDPAPGSPITASDASSAVVTVPHS